MQLSISTRLTLLVTLLVTVSATTISYYSYENSSRILVGHALQSLSLNLQREGDQLRAHIGELQRDVLFLADSPPLPGLIRAAQNRGYDPLGKSSQAQWMKRLNSLFLNMLSTKPDYFQVRLIDANGRELLKLEQSNNTIRKIPRRELQDKSQRDYFQAAKRLKAGQLYLSAINLNREFGKIRLPHRPVLRCATAVYQGDRLFAIVIINLDMSQQLAKLKQVYGSNNQTVYVTNSQGAYLSHPDPTKRFAFELGHHFRLQEDFPLLADMYSPSNHELSRNIIPKRSDGNIMVFVKVPYGEPSRNNFIAVGLERSYTQILEGVTKVLQRSLAIISLFVFLSILFALGFGSLLVRPLKQIVNNIEGYTKGNKAAMPVQRRDEIGILARALESMADNVFSSHQELRTLNARLEDEVEARTGEVQQNLRLLNTISSAQSAFIGEPDTKHAFEIMLDGLLEVSESEYGFIGEVLFHDDATPYLKSRAITNIAWDEETRKLYRDNLEQGLAFFNLDSLFGRVMLTKQAVISNDPANDERAGGIPQGHPPLNAFLGLPIFNGDKLVGMAGIANRANGYDKSVIHQLTPFITTCANMIAAIQARYAAQQKDIELNQARAELERVTNISPVIFYVIRANGDFATRFVSPNITQMFGYEVEECLNDPDFWTNNIHPDDRQQAMENQRQVFVDGHLVHSYRFRKKSGQYLWVHDELQLIRDPQGEPKEIAGYWLDITDRKQAELQLLESEQRFRSIINSSPMGIFIYKLIGGRLIVADHNPSANKILGIECSRFIGMSIEEAFPNTTGTEAIEHLKRVAREGLPWNTEDNFYDEKSKISGAFEVHAFQTVPDTIAVMFLDITERKRAQDELTRFKATLDQTQDCVFMFSAETLQYFYVNQGAMFLVGYSQQELMQLHPYDLNVKLANAQAFRKFVSPLLDGRQLSLMFETEYRCKNGSLVPVEVILQHISPEDQAPRFVAMVRDITERKKIDRMKNEFVSTVSHELRTPLTSIRGSLGLISGGAVGELPEKMQQMLQIASNNTDRLLLLINDILDIQKIESGQMSFQFEAIDVMALLDQAVRDNAIYAEQFAVRFEITLREDGARVLGDHDRLMQVINNLLSNAAKFSPRGETVELTVAQHDDALRISVTDHGQGIAEDFQPSLFEQFTQSDASDSRQKGGTGLGLSIVKAIVDRHGGRIDFITGRGLGTTMMIELPVYQPRQMISDEPIPARLGPHTACILIVEDDPDVATLLNRLLSASGFSCDVANTLDMARQYLKHNAKHYKAMTLDINLPDGNGLSLLKELRSNALTSSLPVIVVAVEADEARRHLNGNAIGIIDWLEKPIDEQRLQNMLAGIKPEAGKARILHIEDELDIHQIVKDLIAEKAELDWATNLREAKEFIEAHHYDLALIDLSLPDGSGLSLIPQLKQQRPATKLVIFSAHELAPEYLQEVHAVLTKSTVSTEQFLTAITSLLAE